MKRLNLMEMEQIHGGKSWLSYACGVGVASIQLTFAIPALFAFTAPLTAGACLAATLDTAIKAGY
jgi:hypothetical protein